MQEKSSGFALPMYVLAAAALLVALLALAFREASQDTSEHRKLSTEEPP